MEQLSSLAFHLLTDNLSPRTPKPSNSVSGGGISLKGIPGLLLLFINVIITAVIRYVSGQRFDTKN